MLINYKKEIKALEEEIENVKRYYKRTKDDKILITNDNYTSLLTFKLKVLKEMNKQKVLIK